MADGVGFAFSNAGKNALDHLYRIRPNGRGLRRLGYTLAHKPNQQVGLSDPVWQPLP